MDITTTTTTQDILRERDAARYVAMTPGWLRKMRRFNEGPAFLRHRRTILYRVSDLDAWLNALRVETKPPVGKARRRPTRAA